MIMQHKGFEDIKLCDESGAEYWLARDLAPLLNMHDGKTFQR